MMAIRYSGYARHETGSSMASRSYETAEEARADVAEYVARCEDQGMSAVVYTDVVACCSTCGGSEEHQRVLTARKHAHRYHHPERCYKACPDARATIA